MRLKHRTASVGLIVVVFCVLTISLTRAQSPTATPTTTTPATATSITPTPSTVTAFVTRQAVVKRPIDGDSVEVVFTDDGQIATIHLANVDAPESVKDAECFGRESAEFAAQAYGENPLVSIELVDDVEGDEALGYIKLANGTLLNRLVVLFGYARYDDQVQSEFSAQIQEAEEQSKQGKTGLWRNCGETEAPPKPCFIFSEDGLDSASKREVLNQYPDKEMSTSFLHAYYDSVQHEIVVTWCCTLIPEVQVND